MLEGAKESCFVVDRRGRGHISIFMSGVARVRLIQYNYKFSLGPFTCALLLYSSPLIPLLAPTLSFFSLNPWITNSYKVAEGGKQCVFSITQSNGCVQGTILSYQPSQNSCTGFSPFCARSPDNIFTFTAMSVSHTIFLDVALILYYACEMLWSWIA